MLIVLDPPLQMAPATVLITDVGRALTTTAAEPVRSPDTEVQFASLNADTV